MIRSHGGIFGRNPAFQNVEVQGDLTVSGIATFNTATLNSLIVTGDLTAGTIGLTTPGWAQFTEVSLPSGSIGATSGTALINFDGANQLVTIGDVFGVGAGTNIIIDDNQQAITFNGLVNPINQLAFKGTGGTNIAIGDAAGSALDIGALDNVLIGYSAGDAITTGDRNVAMGTNALGAISTGTDSVAIGYQALLLNTANGSIAIGSNALDAVTTGTNNVGIGLDAGTALNTGANNLAIGTNALKVATTVSDNVAIGFNALQGKSSSGNGNVAVGTSAAYRLTTGAQNTAIGYQALFGGGAGPNTCTANTAVGYNSLVGVTSGSYNSGIGISSLFSVTTGQQNTAVGTESLYSITTTSDNTAIGQLALRNVTNGSGNIAIGINAARYKTSSNTNHTLSGDYNVYIAPQARASGDSVTNEVAIGGLNCLGLGSNTTTIGTTATTANRIYGVASTGQVAPTIASAATIAPTTSIVFISGTTQINTITAPTLIAGTGGRITLIPTGLWTTGTTGNIALASIAVVSRALTMTYDAGTAKWYPSY